MPYTRILCRYTLSTMWRAPRVHSSVYFHKKRVLQCLFFLSAIVERARVRGAKQITPLGPLRQFMRCSPVSSYTADYYYIIMYLVNLTRCCILLYVRDIGVVYIGT